MNLKTGKIIHSFKCTNLATPNHVIDRVLEVAGNEGATVLDGDSCPIFEWESKAPIRGP